MVNASWLLVAVIYAGAVWLARRAGFVLRPAVALFFYLLVFIFMHQALTRDVVNLPVDFLKTLPPWSYTTRDHHTVNSDINDIVLQIVPWAHQVRQSWWSGEVPLWNHLSGSGYPLLANAQSAAFSPLRLLTLVLPLGQSFAAEAALKLLMAMTFTFLFCRRRGYSELASGAGALSFGFCSFLLVWLHFPLATAAAFVPAIIFQLDLLLERITYKRFVFAAVLWAALLYSGHPETAAHIFFISILYLLWVLLAERPHSARVASKLVGTLGLSLLVAALLAAPFLAPFFEGLTKSKRYHELKVNPTAVGYYSDWPSFVVLLQPHFFGKLPGEKSWGPATAESITGFAGIMGLAGWLALLAQVMVTRSWRSREAFFVAATLIVLGVIMAWPGVGEAFHALFRLAANARLRLLFCFLLAVQAAAAFDLLQRGSKRPFLFGLLGSAALLLILDLSTEFPSAAHRDTALLAMLPSMVVLLFALVSALLPRYREGLLMILLVAVIGELWSAGRGWNPNVPRRWMYPSTPLITALAEMKEKDPPHSPARIVGLGPAFFPNVSAIYGLEDIRAHDPMATGRYLGVLRVLTGYNTDDYFAKWEKLDTGVLDFLNVKHVITTPRHDLGDPQRFALVYDGKDGRIYESQTVLPRFYAVRNVVLEFRDEQFVRLLTTHDDWANTALLEELPVENDRMRLDLLAPRPPGSKDAAVQITSAAGDRFAMRVQAPRYSLVVSSIPFWPGWKVTRNGEPVRTIRANGSFLAFVVPPGTWEVGAAYSPLTFRAGAIAAVLTIVTLLIAGWRFRLSGTFDSTAPAPPSPPA